MRITWSGVLAIEGTPTHESPRRLIEPGALEWAELPLPLRVVMSDEPAHRGAATVGTIDTITRVDDRLEATGTFDHESAIGLEAARLAARRIKRGISIDPSAIDADIELRLVGPDGANLNPADFSSPDELPDGTEIIQAMVGGRIRGATLLDIPAIEGAEITEVTVHDDEPDEEMEPDPDAVVAAAVEHDGAMVALVPSEADATRLAVPDYEPPEVLHLTLYFLGDSADYTPEDRDRIEAALRDVDITPSGPVTGDVWASAHFNPGGINDHDPAATYLVGNQDIVDVRGSLNDFMHEFGLDDINQHSPFIPHITIGYELDPAGLAQFGEVTFDRLRLAFGNDDVRDIDLTATAPDEEPEPEPDEDDEPALVAAAVPPHDTNAVGPDVDWDGNQAEAALPTGEPPAFYRRFYAYQAPDTDGTAKDHWHYIHHFVEGTGADANVGAASVEACRAIIGLLNGARGVDPVATGEDRKIVYDHMATHMRAADETPPEIKANPESTTASAAPELSEEPMPTVNNPTTIPEVDDDCDSIFDLTAAALSFPTLPASHFTPIPFTAETPLTVSESGHVFGHIAPNSICHVGMPKCVTMPRSASNLRYFHTGVVRLDDDTDIATGRITVRGPHADLNLNWRSAMAHYDDVTTAVADVIAYEDDHGIAVTGHVRPGTPPELVHALRASTPSGDWRNIGGTPELINVHMVNSPGFPVYRTSGDRIETTIVASILPPNPHATDDPELAALIASAGHPDHPDHPGSSDGLTSTIASKVVTIIENNQTAREIAEDLAPAREHLATRLRDDVRPPYPTSSK